MVITGVALTREAFAHAVVGVGVEVVQGLIIGVSGGGPVARNTRGLLGRGPTDGTAHTNASLRAERASLTAPMLAGTNGTVKAPCVSA